MSVIKAMSSYNRGKLPIDDLFEALIDHPTWHLAADARNHALLWTLNGQRYAALMANPVLPTDDPGITMPMRAVHLAQNLPSDADAVAFELGTPHAVGLTPSQMEQLVNIARAPDIEAMLDAGNGDPRLLLKHHWLSPGRDERPAVVDYRGLKSILLFANRHAYDAYRNAWPEDGTKGALRSVGGQELFEHLATRDDFDAIWIDPESLRFREPFGPAAIFDLLEGRDPRTYARILPARSIAEIHHFLDMVGMRREGRTHTLEYENDQLVAIYRGEIVGARQCSYRFELVAEAGGNGSFGDGASPILCAGKLADLVRRRLESIDETVWSRDDGLAAYADIAALWALETEKMIEPGRDRLSRRVLRSADGARFVRERPGIATRDWLSAARHQGMMLAKGGANV